MPTSREKAKESNEESGFETLFDAEGNNGGKLTDIDELFSNNDFYGLDDDSFFDDNDDDDDDSGDFLQQASIDPFYQNPNADALMKNDVTNIPGSPWAKPPNKLSNRPKEPLPAAKYASIITFALSIVWVLSLFVHAIWNYVTVGRIIVEVLLALLSFLALFWNTYFVVSSISKCFIPFKAFQQNTKYCSMIPEKKHACDKWLDVTIQIPVYKESLKEVLIPTLKSCMAARDHYVSNSHAKCNIVICDDGIMAFLKNNFSAVEMLWESIVQSEGKILKLGSILKRVPRPARRHLKGLSSRNIYEVFHRLLFYYHYDIGWVARSTIDRRGKFKKASNLNSHLRLMFAAEEIIQTDGTSFVNALHKASHSEGGSREIMFGNDIAIGALIVVNDADARMKAPVILKTVPEFLNDTTLGFTQHATKTMDDQRGESYFLDLIAGYTDALYQGHFLLSSILGCHPPLVGHSIFLRTEAIKQCGRMRTLKKAAIWLKNIGLPFLSVDQCGFGNLQKASHTEYWSENHVSEDFELMIHLYNLGYNGRYIAYPDCEFQEGVTRTFDEEAGRHRKFSLGAHELIFNPFQDMIGHGIFSPLFRTFLTCDIPSYYKIYLTAYLFSYTAGGTYLTLFTIAAMTRIIDNNGAVSTLYAFSPAAVIILNVVVYYIIGYPSFLIALLRMHIANKNLFFPKYRNRGKLFLLWHNARYAMTFQIFFYSAMGNYFFLGSMDHMLSKAGIVSATNKDSIKMSRCKALSSVIRFNSGSWILSILMIMLAYATVLDSEGWNFTSIPRITEGYLESSLLFAVPMALIAMMSFVVPIILNPYVLGWPFYRQNKSKVKELSREKSEKSIYGRKVAIDQYIATTKQLNEEIERVEEKPDIELGSLATPNLGSNPLSIAGYTSQSLLENSGYGRLGGETYIQQTIDESNSKLMPSKNVKKRQQIRSKKTSNSFRAAV